MPALDEWSERLRAATARLQGRGEEGAPRTVPWRDRHCVLYRYERLRPATFSPAPRTPLLICYALVNRPTMLDLSPAYSLVRRLLEGGVDVWLLDWGYPSAGDRVLGLRDYIDGWLGEAVLQVWQNSGKPPAGINLLGVCQGGTFSLCQAALHPERIRNLITMVTPVDFQTPDDLLSGWARGVDAGLLATLGNVPGSLLNAVYRSLLPFRLTQQKYLSLPELSADQEALAQFLRMEQWIEDSPDQPARAFAQFVQWFYQENRLMHGGLDLGAARVDLKRIRCPVLNVFGSRDHLVPPAASRALRGLTGSEDYTEIELDLGHIGMYVSRRAQEEVGPAITRWLLARDA
ncbi:MAG: class III poly(R)-hydroxyalkanoic acid synthase subunit PhaC [Steroidobacteraceae bacterium]